jgi:hypothetical protein
MSVSRAIDEYKNEVDLYLRVILDIKARLRAIDKYMAQQPGLINITLEIEFMCLQMRSVLELIILGSLVTNSRHYNKTEEELKKMWRVRSMMKQLEPINKEFFPIPVEIVTLDKPNHFDIRPYSKNDVLLKDELPDMYDSLCDFTHPKNPYAEEKDFAKMKVSLISWWYKIARLLDVYVIQLVDVKVKFLILSKLTKPNEPSAFILVNDL